MGKRDGRIDVYIENPQPFARPILKHIRKAVQAGCPGAATLNEQGVTVTRPKKTPKPPPSMPPAFEAALKNHKKAQAAFTALSPSHQREYLEWITDAKQEATRERRIARTLEWLSEGKSRNWKHQ